MVSQIYNKQVGRTEIKGYCYPTTVINAARGFRIWLILHESSEHTVPVVALSTVTKQSFYDMADLELKKPGSTCTPVPSLVGIYYRYPIRRL